MLDKKKTYLLTIRTGYFVVIAFFAFLAVLCVGVTGIYFGSMQQASKSDEQLTRYRRLLSQQQLAYEKRLGEQSARYAVEASAFASTLATMQKSLESLQQDNRTYAAARQASAKRAIAAAQAAASEARASRDKLALIQQQTQETKATVQMAASAATTAASTAKETQKALEGATYNKAIVPATPQGTRK